MTAKQENFLTLGLVAVCCLLVLINLIPRLTVQQQAVVREQPDITVSIAGEVEAPGVYTLAWGSSVLDLIKTAGGFTPTAGESLVNLAAPLDTGQRVVVPQARTETGDERISLNNGSELQLGSLPGIGPALTQRIIAARPFGSVEDLLEVSGIGPATLEQLRPLVKP